MMRRQDEGRVNYGGALKVRQEWPGMAKGRRHQMMHAMCRGLTPEEMVLYARWQKREELERNRQVPAESPQAVAP